MSEPEIERSNIIQEQVEHAVKTLQESGDEVSLMQVDLVKNVVPGYMNWLSSVAGEHDPVKILTCLASVVSSMTASTLITVLTEESINDATLDEFFKYQTNMIKQVLDKAPIKVS